jgi:hypothetical protein
VSTYKELTKEFVSMIEREMTFFIELQLSSKKIEEWGPKQELDSLLKIMAVLDYGYLDGDSKTPSDQKEDPRRDLRWWLNDVIQRVTDETKDKLITELQVE